jgi:hypothetical protein
LIAHSFSLAHREFLAKYKFDAVKKSLVRVPLTEGATGFAFMGEAFAVGAERLGMCFSPHVAEEAPQA